jgi:hypothetical protein
LGFACAIALLGVASSTAASAQVQIGSGATLSVGTLDTDRNRIDLGTTPTTGYISSMPMSLTYGTTNVNVGFTGVAGILGANEEWSPAGTNFFRTGAQNTGSVTFNFSETQRYFGTQWGSPDQGNYFDFYNGNQLIASANSSNLISLGAQWDTAGKYAEFSFGEVGFDSVVAYSTGGRVEFADVSFGETVDVAPIPISGVGGILALLGMFGARRGGASFRFAWRNAKPFRNLQKASIG